ncbi:MAG: PD40 domain-containing protein [Acidobacteria bacterium]|nr:PD40 domain-containing protein [Acidobacteriota bacterium]
MRNGILAPFLLAAQAAAQVTSPVLLRPGGYVVQPAVSADGRAVAFASNVAPDGSAINAGADAYLYTQGGTSPSPRKLTQVTGGASVTALSLTPDGARAAYTLFSLASPAEEVHVVSGSPPVDTTVSVDKLSCIKPLVICPNCIFACLDAPHLSPDGKSVLYTAKRSQPFYLAAADGSGVTNLKVYSGSLAPAPVRVISTGGTVVFTSAAPNGPTLVASATDVYRMKLDGSGIAPVTAFGNNANLFARNATISADGSLIAFESNYDPAAKTAGSVVRVYAIAPDGTGLRAIGDGAADATNPTLTADGSAIAYLENGAIRILPTSGPVTAVRPIEYAGSQLQDPVLSEDGSRVVFTLAPPNGSRSAVIAVDLASRAETPVFAPAFLQPSGIVSAAGFGAAPAAGSLISAYGANFTSTGDIAVPAGFPLPQQLAGVSLVAGGQALPLTAVSRWQVNAQLPPGATGAPLDFQVTHAGTATNAITLTPQTAAPALFLWLAGFQGTPVTYWQAAALHAGTGIPADAAHPAAAGEVLELYGTGFGPTNPIVPAGQAAPASPLALVTTLPEVRICGAVAPVTFAGLAPGLAGVYQVNAGVPGGLKPGLCAVEVRAGASADASGQIAVR